MKQYLRHLLILLCVLGITSCDRVAEKSAQVIEQVKKETEKQTQKVVDRVFPTFDHDKANTENNKKRFDEFIKVPRTQDVKNIYCFDDAIGIDADYMFAFNCNQETSNKIIEQHQLELNNDGDNAFGLQSDFDWWDKEQIKTLQKYSWADGNQYFKYYWYDAENEHAYFFDFDL